MKKATISREKLQALLQEEFGKTAGDSCLACRIPMPTSFAGARDGANWRLPAPGECSSLCHTIIEDLFARYAAKYDLADG